MKMIMRIKSTKRFYNLKKSIAIVLFFCVTASPVYQLGFTAYYIFNLESIIYEYCVNKDQPIAKCNANCYLSEKLAVVEGAEKNGDKKANTSILVYFPLYFEPVKTDSNLFLARCKNSFFCNTQDHYNSLALKVPLPPPKV